MLSKSKLLDLEQMSFKLSRSWAERLSELGVPVKIARGGFWASQRIGLILGGICVLALVILYLVAPESFNR